MQITFYANGMKKNRKGKGKTTTKTRIEVQ